MSLNQLQKLGGALNLKLPKDQSKTFIQKLIINCLRLKNSGNFSDKSMDCDTHCDLEKKNPLELLHKPSSMNNMLAEIDSLREEIKVLKSNLDKSEGLRWDLEKKFQRLQKSGNNWALLSEVMKLDSNRSIRDDDDQNIGLVWNLSNMSTCFKTLDEELVNLMHASRGGSEHPLVIMSTRQLEIGSFPVVGSVETEWAELNKAFKVQTNMVGHIVVPQKEVEITAGFAGARGNLLWFNSGETDLMLRLMGEKVSKSIVLEPGFGFCIGKMERDIKIFLSSFNRASDRFLMAEQNTAAHALFFSTDIGDKGSWLCELNANLSDLSRDCSGGVVSRDGGSFAKPKERNHRLGVVLKNTQRNWIRIAPVKGSNLQQGLLKGKISEVERWIKDTLGQATIGSVPDNFSVVSAWEIPKIGEPFEILWAKFNINEDLWSDEVMWDIRYLLMGSKLNKIAGFPEKLNDIRGKLYISRDGFSERGRKTDCC